MDTSPLVKLGEGRDEPLTALFLALGSPIGHLCAKVLLATTMEYRPSRSMGYKRLKGERCAHSRNGSPGGWWRPRRGGAPFATGWGVPQPMCLTNTSLLVSAPGIEPDKQHHCDSAQWGVPHFITQPGRAPEFVYDIDNPVETLGLKRCGRIGYGVKLLGYFMSVNVLLGAVKLNQSRIILPC